MKSMENTCLFHILISFVWWPKCVALSQLNAVPAEHGIDLTMNVRRKNNDYNRKRSKRKTIARY